MKRIRIRRLSLRELFVIGLPSLALVVAGFWVASKFIKPASPDRIVISTGGEGGAYHDFGFVKRYAALPLASSELLFTSRWHVDMLRAKIAARWSAA